MRSSAGRRAAILILAFGCSAGVRDGPGLLPAPPAPRAEVDVTLFLVGDAGAPAPAREPVLVALGRDAAAAIAPVIVYLGDNIYPNGMPDSTAPGRAEAVRRLEVQIEAARASAARAVFVPGNHDWGGGAGGWDAVRRQTDYLRPAAPETLALPGDGCPGPVVLDLGTTTRLIALDTQWWLHHGPRPLDPTSACATDSPTEIVAALRAALGEAGARRVVIVAHHPLASGGPHGGYFRWQEHVFPLRELASWLWIPLPVIGSAYPVARQSGISDQDLAGDRYRAMRASLEEALREFSPLVYAAGHEHTLEVLGGSSARYYVVSGAGTYGQRSRVRWLDSTRFAASRNGYMRLELLRTGGVRLGVTVVGPDASAREVYALWLVAPGSER